MGFAGAGVEAKGTSSAVAAGSAAGGFEWEAEGALEEEVGWGPSSVTVEEEATEEADEGVVGTVVVAADGLELLASSSVVSGPGEVQE